MAKKRKAGEEKLTPQPQPPSEKIIKKEEEEEEKIDNGEEDQISEEDFKALMEPFSKEQLCHIIRDLAANDANVLSDIRKLADKDPAHRKIFVRGIGWDTTSEILKSVFSEYGELEECTVIMDKGTGKSKGYGFVTYKHMDAAQRAMKEPSKKIDNRMAACQMACLGPVPQQPTSDPAGRKIYVSNVPADMPADKLLSFFSKYGEVEEGPLGFDKQTGKSRGFALFIYKTAEGAKKVLEEPNKNIDGHSMHCKRATENQKPKINVTHTVPSVAGPLDPNDLALTYDLCRHEHGPVASGLHESFFGIFLKLFVAFTSLFAFRARFFGPGWVLWNAFKSRALWLSAGRNWGCYPTDVWRLWFARGCSARTKSVPKSAVEPVRIVQNIAADWRQFLRRDVIISTILETCSWLSKAW
ncbi:hypothetical protein SUGI_1097800 [Cryptomeria japonica]|nr:hypothetical protein SUGI_1097800 [Cryptomeria japonica]